MKCPNCASSLRPEMYEGIEIEICNDCGGEWLDAQELGKIVRLREARFNEEERRAIAESATIKGVKLADVDRDLVCPKCGSITDPVNYGGDSGIVLDRCPTCQGIWLDRDELEKIQMLVEGWNDSLPEDLKKHGPKLRQVAAEVDARDDVRISRLPLVGGFINTCINGILDLTS